MLDSILTIAGIAGGAVALGALGSFGVANILFNKIIPRQDGVKVNMKEMADADKWEEYKKGIAPRKEYLMSYLAEHITVKAKDGITLHGDYFPVEGSKKIAVCFHGYTSANMANASFASFLHKQGISCLLVDNRAHGQSEGKYIGFGVLDRFDCISWLNYVNERFGEDTEIILYGVSMGGSTILMAAGLPDFPKNVKGIIADCAFTSPYDVFCHVLKRDYKIPEFPVMGINDKLCRKRAGYGFKDCTTLETLKNTNCPVLFIHGKEDNFVPVWMSEKNYEICSSDKMLILVPNAGHGASYYENTELYETAATEFLNKHLN